MPIVQRATCGVLLIIYGMWGIGKTMMAAALARLLYKLTGKPALLAEWDPDGETVIPEDVPFVLWKPRPTVFRADGTIESGDPVDEAFEMAAEFATGKYSLLIVDTVATMCANMLFNSIALVSRKESGETVRTRVITKAGRVLTQPDEMDYGVAINTFRRLYTACSPGMWKGGHVLWLSHDTIGEKRNPKTREVIEQIGGPELVGFKLTKSVPKDSFVTLRMANAIVGMERIRVLMPESEGLYYAKDRTGAIPRGYKLEVPRFEVERDAEGKPIVVGQKDGKPVLKQRELNADEHKARVLSHYEKVWQVLLAHIKARQVEGPEKAVAVAAAVKEEEARKGEQSLAGEESR